MKTSARRAALVETGVAVDRLYCDVLTGLARRQKELPCKYLYDERGSRLFERICEVEEYYPTRVEIAILAGHAQEMAAALGADALLIEPGAGSCVKTRILLEHMREPAGYIPIDISGEHLAATARSMALSFPHLEILPVHADFMDEIELPACGNSAARRVAFFPGSTIGNLTPQQAVGFLEWIRSVCRKDGALLIGVDLEKDPAILERAYNDRAGVTAEFNLNLLHRLNRELGANFRIDNFRHHAFYSPQHKRVEMHLVSLVRQSVRIANVEILFEKNETIRTECCYKFSLEGFRALAASADLEVRKVWTDPQRFFSVQLCSARIPYKSLYQPLDLQAATFTSRYS
jgi:dimethylhistidine N-methyltransferase